MIDPEKVAAFEAGRLASLYEIHAWLSCEAMRRDKREASTALSAADNKVQAAALAVAANHVLERMRSLEMLIEAIEKFDEGARQ